MPTTYFNFHAAINLQTAQNFMAAVSHKLSCHLAALGIAVRRCAVLMVPEGECPHPGRSHGRSIGLEDAGRRRALGI
jgi:hypothetical protein